MKTTIHKTFVVLLISSMITGMAACHYGRTTTIIENTNNFHQKIKYRGTIVLNDANTGIDHISPGGFLEYERNDHRFEAKQGVSGGIYYSFDGDSEVNRLSKEQQALVTQAVQAIEKARARK